MDGLAVRGGPGIAYPLLGAERHTEDGVVPLGVPYRLTAGDELVIMAGPLRVDGRTWYSVRYLSDVMWVPPGDAGPTAEGWVAAGEGGTAYLELSSVPDELCCFYASGVGNGVTPPAPQLPICAEPTVCAVWWTAGQADPDGKCDLRMTVETTGALLVTQPITGVAQGVAVPWVREEAAIAVDSDCSWSLEVRWGPQP